MRDRRTFEREIGLVREAQRPPIYTGEVITFQSGETLQVVTGLPVAKYEDYWDPTGSGNPLLDTGPAHKNKKLSPNFTVRELTTSGGMSADIARIDPRLVECLQRLRDQLGKGITITSGFRSWKRNRDIYLARKKKPTLSQHCAGRAVDISIVGMNGVEIGKAAIDAYGHNIGVGLGNTFAHIDVRGFAVAWNYGGVKDVWITEIKRYQKEKVGTQKPATGTAAQPKTAGGKPASELVRFVQRVLNATEGERLGDDGDLGPLTRGALERFRRKYKLGVGGVLDDKTRIALAQRALEEIAQQSIFPQLGVFDAKTEQVLITFKSERGLGFNATLDVATRTAITEALVRRVGSPGAPTPSQRQRLPDAVAGSRSPSETITSPSGVSITGGKWGGWKGRQTKATTFISPNYIKDKYDLAVAVAAEVETSGAFDKVQMYDKGILSWGIKQWTLHRGSLQKLLGFIKNELVALRQNSLWTEVFPGIDIQADNKIVINGAAYSIPKKDGDPADLALRKVFRGKESPEDFDKDRMDHWLVVFARAGRHPDIKRLHFKYAAESLKKNLNKHLGELLKAWKVIKESEIHNYRRVGDYIENSSIAITLFNGMETQNPKWTYLYLKRIIDRVAEKYGRNYDISRWPSGWQEKFAEELKKEFEESGVACWGRKALEKRACKGRTSRTEKILRAYSELSRKLESKK
ncbi:MAG: hypothetical protein CV087_07165 [Candidatus Brocadia sp. WS118]|nr:MAG: hypothetical protein CV087_07165 [Candidatus Brocadia sp. WS118]